jgi:hypothetical protein
MHEFIFLQDLLILLAVALGNALLFSQLRQSPIIGYLVTGVLIGPLGLHLVRNTTEVEVMAEFGVIMLLFTIGLEFSRARIASLKSLLLKSGTTQIVLTVVLVGLLFVAAGFAPATAVCIGLATSLSSSTIVLKMLLEAFGWKAPSAGSLWPSCSVRISLRSCFWSPCRCLPAAPAVSTCCRPESPVVARQSLRVFPVPAATAIAQSSQNPFGGAISPDRACADPGDRLGQRAGRPLAGTRRLSGRHGPG